MSANNCSGNQRIGPPVTWGRSPSTRRTLGNSCDMELPTSRYGGTGIRTEFRTLILQVQILSSRLA